MFNTSRANPCSRSVISTLAFSALLAAMAPAQSFACACGCGLFDVATGGLLPTQEEGTVWFEYDFLNQDKNWHHGASAPSANNADKDIKTSYFIAGARYMFSRAWGVQASMPYADRHFTTTDDGTGNVTSFDHSDIGDLRLKAIYSGFSGDMSSGITFGVKLPTGDHHYAHFDRDTSIGTGSTDFLLGAYHMGKISSTWDWFSNGELDQPALIRGHYRPGAEVNISSGIYYDGWTIGSVRIAPIAQVIGSYHAHDSGIAADPDNTGYERVLLAPGMEASVSGLRIYGDVEMPVYEYTKGNQLVAPVLFKLNISHSF